MRCLGLLSSIKKQQGLALITVLFIFALVSLLAISMQSRQKMSMAQASASISLTQAQLLMVSTEDIAKAALKFEGDRDLNGGDQWDTASELWNKVFPVEVPGANIEIYIRDLQGLFNLNSLAPGTNAAVATQRFERLLDELLIPGANTIAQNTRDWMDPNSSANNLYQSEEPPYSASANIFTHPSELMLIQEVNRDIFRKIEPYVTALPTDTALNINTSHAKILQSWDTALKLDDAEEVIAEAHGLPCGPQARKNNLFEKVDDFWAHAKIAPLVKVKNSTTGKWDPDEFDVYTKYFSVFIKITTEDRELVLESIIKRDMTAGDEFIGVVYRDFSRKVEDIPRLVIDMKVNQC